MLRFLYLLNSCDLIKSSSSSTLDHISLKIKAVYSPRDKKIRKTDSSHIMGLKDIYKVSVKKTVNMESSCSGSEGRGLANES